MRYLRIKVRGRVFHATLLPVELESIFREEDISRLLKLLRAENIHLVAINADAVYSPKFLEHAIYKALRAWIDGRMVSKKLAIEVLLYISLSRQISEAVEEASACGRRRIVLVCIASNIVDLNRILDALRKIGYKFKVNQNLIEPSPEKMKYFRSKLAISDRELQAYRIRGSEDQYEVLEKALIERLSIFDIEKD